MACKISANFTSHYLCDYGADLENDAQNYSITFFSVEHFRKDSLNEWIMAAFLCLLINVQWITWKKNYKNS